MRWPGKLFGKKEALIKEVFNDIPVKYCKCSLLMSPGLVETLDRVEVIKEQKKPPKKKVIKSKKKKSRK